MTFDDWLMSAFNVAIGFFLGLAVYGLAELFLSGSWLLALAVIVPWLVWLLFYVLLEGLFERVFPSSLQQARRAEARLHKPWTRKLSLPAGFAVGAFVAWLGLTGTILGVL